MTAPRSHAPQSPAREIVLRSVRGERWIQKDFKGFAVVVDGKRLYVQGVDLKRLSLVCELLHAEWVKEQADAYAAALEANAVGEAAAVEVKDFRVPA